MPLLSSIRRSPESETQVTGGHSETQRDQSRLIGTPNYLRTAPEAVVPENSRSDAAQGTSSVTDVSLEQPHTASDGQTEVSLQGHENGRSEEQTTAQEAQEGGEEAQEAEEETQEGEQETQEGEEETQEGEQETQEGEEETQEGEQETQEGEQEGDEPQTNPDGQEQSSDIEAHNVVGPETAGGQPGKGHSFLKATAIPRLGIRTPLVHSPPKPSLERADEITTKTGKPPELHHAQVQDMLNRTTQGTRDAQRQMVQDIEKIATKTHFSAEQMAAEIPGVVAACVANITQHINNTKDTVKEARDQYMAHIHQYGVLVGEELQQNRNRVTVNIFNELQQGAEHIEESNSIIQAHFDANLELAAGKIEQLPNTGTFTPIPDPHPSKTKEKPKKKQKPSSGSQSKTTAEAKTALSEWLPEGASKAASEVAGQGLANYYSRRSESAVPAFLAPTQEQIAREQPIKATQLNSPANRASFAIMALGLTAPVYNRHNEDSNDTEQTAEQQVKQNQREILTGVQQAQKTLEGKTTGVVDQLDLRLKPKLIKNVRKSGQKIQQALIEQGIAAQSALITSSAQMADAYREIIQRLKQLLPENRFLDARFLVPKIKAALISAQELRNSHVKAAQQQAASTLMQLDSSKKDQVIGLWKMTRESTDSLTNVVTQTRFDFLLFAEQMTGRVTEGRDTVIADSTSYADKMAENILRIAGRNDNEAVPHLESLSANFLNSNITAARDWQHQLVRHHEDELKKGTGGFSNVWHSLLTDLNRRSSDLDSAMPDSGTSVGGALASTGAGGMVGGPVGALVGLGLYLWSKDVDDSAVMTALGDLPLPGPPALKEVFNHSGFGQLEPRMRDTMEPPHLGLALGLLSTEESARAEARVGIAQDSTGWFDYNRQARESALRGMTPTERATLKPSQVTALRETLTQDVDGSERTISLAYLDSNRELALAARLQEARQQARRDGNRGARSVRTAGRRGDQAMVDFVARMDQLARTEMAFDSAYITPTQVRAFNQRAFVHYANLEANAEERPPGGFSNQQAQEFVIQQLTQPRTVVVGQGDHYRVETVAMSKQAEDYIRDTINHGSDSDQSRDSRAVYEIANARAEGSELSETTQMRLTQTLENPRLSDLRARLEHATSPDEIASLEQQVAAEETKHQQRMTRVAERLGAPESVLADSTRATEWLGNEVGTLFAREGSQHARYGQELIERGRPSMVAGIALAIDKAGTHEDLLLHTYRGRTRAEITSIQEQWAEEHPGENLNQILGIEEQQWDTADSVALAMGPVAYFALQGFRGGETSGDVAMQLQQLALLGTPTTDLDAVNMAGLRVDQQERGTGFLADVSMSFASETDVMNERRARVGGMVLNAAHLSADRTAYYRQHPEAIFGTNGQLNSELRTAAFDNEGQFRGDTLALHGLTHATGLAADNYQAEIDRQESILTTAITVITIAVSIALMFIPGVNLVAAGILTALIGGAMTMGVKYGMRGERYGWEEAATDLAQTGIEAATAGIGGAMAGGLGKSGAMFRAGSAINGAFGKVGGAMVREAITGALSNVAQAGIQDDTFKDGSDRGIERLLNSALKGAAVGAVSAGISEKLGDTMDDAMRTGMRNADNFSGMQRLGQTLGPNGRNAFREGVSEALGSSMSEGVGIMMDYANGDFKGNFGDALKRMGQAGLRDMVSGAGRSVAGARNRSRFNDLLSAARQKGSDLTPREARALRLAGISAGTMNYDTPLNQVQREVSIGQQARQHLPAQLQPLANHLNAQSLQQLMQGMDSGSFGNPKQKLDFIRSIADQIPGLDQRRLAQDLNSALSQTAVQRAKMQADQASRVQQQKQARNTLLADISGPARKALRNLPIDGLETLSPSAMKQMAEMIASGRLDQRQMSDLLTQAKVANPDVDDIAFVQNLVRAVDTSRRAQAAVAAGNLQRRQQLVRVLPQSSLSLISKFSDTDVKLVQRIIEGAAGSQQRNSLFKRAHKQNPELSRILFDQILDAGAAHQQERRVAEQQQKKQNRLKQMEHVPKQYRQHLANLPEAELLLLRLSQQQGHLSDVTRKKMIAATLKSKPDLDMNALNLALDATMAYKTGPQLSRKENSRLRQELLSGVPKNERFRLSNTPILRISDAEFEAMTRSEKGQAVTLIIDGKTVVIIRQSADPKVLREEGLHALQRLDPQWAQRLGALDERTLAQWDQLPLRQQIELYRKKVDIEIDAQHRLIHSLEADLSGTNRRNKKLQLLGEIELAKASLDALVQRHAEVSGIDEIKLLKIQQGVKNKPQWLDQPARLFNKVKKSKINDSVDVVLQRLLSGIDPNGQRAADIRNIADKLGEQTLRSIDALAPDGKTARRLMTRMKDSPQEVKAILIALKQLPQEVRDSATISIARKRDGSRSLVESLAGIRNKINNDTISHRLIGSLLDSSTDSVAKIKQMVTDLNDVVGETKLRKLIGLSSDVDVQKSLLSIASRTEKPADYIDALIKIKSSLNDIDAVRLIEQAARDVKDTPELAQALSRIMQLDTNPTEKFKLSENILNRLKEIDSSESRVKLITAISELAKLSSHLAISGDDAANILLRLLDVSDRSAYRFEFLESANGLMKILAEHSYNPNAKTVLDHITGKLLTGTSNELGHLIKDIPRALSLLRETNDRMELLEMFAKRVTDPITDPEQVTLTGGDPVEFKIQRAVSKWPDFAAKNPELVKILEAATPELSMREHALLAQTTLWFNELAAIRGVSDEQGKIDLLRGLLIEKLGANLEGASYYKIKDINSFVRNTVVNESLTGKDPLVRDYLTDLGVPIKDLNKHLLATADEFKAAYMEGRAPVTMHVEALIKQERKVIKMLEIADRIGASTAGLRQKLTEVQGEMAFTIHMLTNPDFSDCRPVVGFEIGNGFDQVWERVGADGKITEFIIGEAKGLGATLGDSLKGGQMTPEWIMNTATELINQGGAARVLGDKLLKAMVDGVPPIRGIVVTAGGEGQSPTIDDRGHFDYGSKIIFQGDITLRNILKYL